MLKIEDLIRKAIIIEEISKNNILGSFDVMFWASHDLLKLMNEILSPSTHDFLVGNKFR